MKLGKSVRALGALGCALIGSTMFAALPALAQEKKMAPWEYTIAKLLHDAGYATALST